MTRARVEKAGRLHLEQCPANELGPAGRGVSLWLPRSRNGNRNEGETLARAILGRAKWARRAQGLAAPMRASAWQIARQIPTEWRRFANDWERAGSYALAVSNSTHSASDKHRSR